MPNIDTDPDLADPDRHALNSDPEPDPEKWCWSDLNRIRVHNTEYNKNTIFYTAILCLITITKKYGQ